MTFKFDQEYRASDEYIQWVSAIKKDYPNMPLYLIEQAIIQHKTHPQYYKYCKDAKEVFNKAPVQEVNKEQQEIKGAVKIEQGNAPFENLLEEKEKQYFLSV